MNKAWWKAAGIRAVRTMAQTAAALIPAAATIKDVDWRIMASTAIMAGATSVLTSVTTGLPEVKEV